MKRDNLQETECSLESGTPAWLLVLAALPFLAVAGTYAFSLVFGNFAPYDDEGYLMITVRGFLEGHPLYDGVSSGYGPFYYLYQWLVHTLASLPVTHDVTRILCIIHWLTASALLAFAGGRMARSAPLAFFIFMQATVHLRHLAREPGVPQEIVVLLLALSALVAAGDWKQPWALPLLGGIEAASALTKVNVGAFFALALLLALACHSPLFQARRLWSGVLLGFTSLLPFALMRQHIAESWARDYSAQVGMGILAAGIVSYVFACEPKMGLKQWFQTGIGFAGFAGIVIGVVVVQGSSIHALVDDLVVGTSRMPVLFWYPLQSPNLLCSGAATLGLAALVVLWRGRSGRLRLPIAIAQGIYGVLGTLVLVADAWSQLCYLLPWAWLTAVPNQENRSTFGRAFICLMAVWQGLQAYPCAGTQVTIATFLLILTFSLCLHDAVKTLMRDPRVEQHLRGISRRTSVLLKALVFTSLLYLFIVEWCMPVARWRAYVSVPSLELPGARYLRLDESQTREYRTLAEYLRTECDTFLIIPGLNSMYFWTGKAPPTYYNINGETILPSVREQNLIIAALRTAKRPLVVINRQGLQFGTPCERLAKSPLGGFLQGECREVKRLGRFRIFALTSAADQGG